MLTCSARRVMRHLVFVLVMLGCAAAARAGQYSDENLFKAAIRGDYLIEPFSGADNFFLPAPLLGSANGYAYAVEPDSGAFGLVRYGPFGISTQSAAARLRVRFTGPGVSGKQVSAFGARMRIASNTLDPVAARLRVRTSSGTEYSFLVSADGTFFALTEPQPIEWFTVDAEAGPGGVSIFEYIDDLYIGSAVICPVGTLGCVDAPTVSAGSFAFTTVGGTMESIAGSCTDSDPGPEVWFRFVAPTSGVVSMSTCGCTYDSVLRVFEGCAPYVQVACNDDGCLASTGTPIASALTFRAAAGNTYVVRIAGYMAASGTGVLTISQSDDCRGDFNHSGGLPTVQDIFEFLVAYFGSCP